MSNLPITSRIKRSPLLFQSTGAINPDDLGIVRVGGVTQGPDTTVTKEVTKTGGLTGKKDKKQMSNEAWKNYLKNETPEQKEKRLKREVEAGLREPDTKSTETTITPGEKTAWEGTLKEKTTGDVMQPWEVRRMSRTIKKEQRDIRRAKIKAARQAGTLTPELRKKIKGEEADAELKSFQAMATRNEAARASGRKTGTSDVTTGQKDMLQSTLGTPEAQKKYLEEQATRDATKKNITVAEENKEKETPEVVVPPAPTEMNPSAFKMYAKSPAAKKLQGAQNTLPQHLQDAIKTAPGKMKAPLKKGYFKK
jgi:hypothetical protein